ncbi:hypothetical protein [Nannocystis pusilla]|uniref:hypothetical protein n=1 Tax=Nannocystis pusilla TaxID=889268 RepID=UPI003B76679A
MLADLCSAPPARCSPIHGPPPAPGLVAAPATATSGVSRRQLGDGAVPAQALAHPLGRAVAGDRLVRAGRIDGHPHHAPRLVDLRAQRIDPPARQHRQHRLRRAGPGRRRRGAA